MKTGHHIKMHFVKTGLKRAMVMVSSLAFSTHDLNGPASCPPSLEWERSTSSMSSCDPLMCQVCTILPRKHPICQVQITCRLKFSLLPSRGNGCLYELWVAGLDRLKLSYKQFFPSPFLQTEQAEIQFTELLTTIGSWPQVTFQLSA